MLATGTEISEGLYMVDDEPTEIEMVPILELRTIPAPGQDPENIHFEWETLNFFSTHVTLQLYYDMPPRVSSAEDLDKLEVTFWGSDYFVSQAGVRVATGSKLNHHIVPQVPPRQGEQIEYWGRDVDTFVKIYLLFVLMCNLIVSGEILSVWMFVNTLQLIFHFPLINQQMPGNASYFCRKLLDLARFNWVPITQEV